MSKLFPFPHARPARPWFRIVVLGLTVLSSAPALALDCPRGQIFWKSKKTCVDKAEAAKLGFYHGHVPKRDEAKEKPADATRDKAVQDKAAQDKAAKDKPAPGADAPAAEIPPPAAPDAQVVQPAAEAPAPATPSPYGELPIDEFAKAK